VTRTAEPKDLFTASDVARYCQVDLKTIHNWADRDEIRHFRTPGRHLRFRRVDVLDFLRRYGYPIPDSIAPERPRVVVLDEDAGARDSIAKELGDEFDVEPSGSLLDSLVGIGLAQPDVIILDAHVGSSRAADVVRTLKSRDATRHVRAVVYSTDDSERTASLEAGASAFVPKPNTGKLRETLEALMGVAR
jgi:excisionase family DNA binding protein